MATNLSANAHLVPEYILLGKMFSEKKSGDLSPVESTMATTNIINRHSTKD